MVNSPLVQWYFKFTIPPAVIHFSESSNSYVICSVQILSSFHGRNRVEHPHSIYSFLVTSKLQEVKLVINDLIAFISQE